MQSRLCRCITPFAASIAILNTIFLLAGLSEDTRSVSTDPFSMNLVTTDGTGRNSTPTNCTTLGDTNHGTVIDMVISIPSISYQTIQSDPY